MTRPEDVRRHLEESVAFGPASEIVGRLHDAGFVALFAGGCVRDALLGVPPHDFDIATDASPATVMGLFPHHVAVGAHFGVVMVIAGGLPYEVATFRSDMGYSDGRHPDAVRFSSPEEDARRRDFTINGLFYDLRSGRVLDFVGGLDDLAAGVVRAIGDPDARFSEDYLRVMRGVRFSARLGFPVEPATWDALCRRVGHLKEISRERVREELAKLLTCSGAPAGLDLLRESGILAAVLPEVQAMVGTNQPPQFHPEGDVFTHTRIMFELARYPLAETLAWGVLLHDVGKPPTYREAERIRFDGHDAVGAKMAVRILRRLAASGEVVERVAELVANHQRFMSVPQMRPGTLKRLLRTPYFDEHLELHRLDCLSSHGILDNHALCVEALSQFGQEELRPPRLLTGDDLIALGYAPGPQFAAILADLEEQQLEGAVADRESALRYVGEKHPPAPAQTKRGR